MNNRIYTILIVSTWLLTGLLTPVVSYAALPSLSATTVYWTTAGKVSSATTNSAKLGATIDTDGGAAITDRGIVWNACSANPDPLVTTDNKVPMGTGTGVYSGTVSGLTIATEICFKGYATNDGVTFAYSPVSRFFTEPDPVPVTSITDPSYFELTVNFQIPNSAEADGVVVVVRMGSDIKIAPYDGTVYTANPRIGLADTTDPGCLFYCEAVVADEPATAGGGTGSVTVTGLKDGFTYYAAAFTYKGTGNGITGINYNRSISSISVPTISAGLISHNEMYVAGTDNGDGTWTPAPETSEGCAYCHGTHHTPDLLPTGAIMAENCFFCHSATGSADTKADVALHLDDGRVDCGTCHSLHSFKKEELYSANNRTDPATKGFNKSFVRANMSKYITDFPLVGGGTITALNNTVFQDRSTDFAFATPDPATDKYNGLCQTCHPDSVAHHRQSGTDGHMSGKLCTSCHPHKKSTDTVNAFVPTAHPVDFGKDIKCLRCHGDINTSVMNDIHGDGTSANCTICHTDPANDDYSTKLGNSANGVDGDARLAFGTVAADNWAEVTCLTCHPAAGTAEVNATAPAHHDSENLYANTGNCGQCHVDPRIPAGYTKQALTWQLACRACHVKVDDAANTLQIVSITYAKENSAAATGSDAGNTYTPLTSHSFINNQAADATDAIVNFGICFECHGTTGMSGYDRNADAPNPAPYHALPIAGAYNASINTIGGGGWKNNLTPSSPREQFRGGLDWTNNGYDAYFPIGKGRINLGYAQHALAEGAAKGTYTQPKPSNPTAVSSRYRNYATGLVFGIQTVPHLLGKTYAVPHFDAICNESSATPCDSVTVNIASVPNLGFNLTATSSTSSSLHIIWGGVQIGTISSGGTMQFRWRDNTGQAIDRYYCMDQFNPEFAQPIWVVSEDGGAAQSGTPVLRGTQDNSPATSPETCSRVFTMPSW
ncbi:MAG: hypothetical protein ACOY3O_13745 [Thermodesulfobacteriota bacterium]